MRFGVRDLLLAAGFCIAASGSSHASIIDFDALPSSTATANSKTPIPDQYEGFTWTNFYYVNSTTYGSGPSGYKNGTVSGTNVGYNGNGDPASFSSGNLFSVESLYLTSAWNNGESVTLNGLRNGAVVNTASYIVSAAAPTFVTLDFSGIDTFQILSSGGTSAGYTGTGTQIAIDNISVSTVPLPASAPLFGASLIALGLVGYRARRRKTAVQV